MRVFVAGGTGAIGRFLLPQLVSAGHEVTVLTRKSDLPTAVEGVRPLRCDVFDRERLVDLVGSVNPQVVINQLTKLPARLNPRRLVAIYAANDRVRREGTANLLEAARRSGTARFVLQSAAYWYAPGGRRVKTEDDPLWTDAPDPVGEAVRTMKSVEESVLSEAGIEGVVLRYGQFYGPGTWYAPDGDIGRRVRKGMYPIIGDGSAELSFVHLGDAAAATVAAATGQAGVYNIVDDEPGAARDWMPAYADALGAKPPRSIPVGLAMLVAGKPLVTWSTSTSGADNARAKAMLGWRPERSSWRTGFAQALG